MTTDFYHGVEVLDVDTEPRPVAVRSKSVIGLVGTAPIGARDRPVKITTLGEGVAAFGSEGGTIPPALDAIFKQARAPVVVVNVLDPDTDKTAVAAAARDFNGDVIDLGHKYVNDVVVTTTADVACALGIDYTLDAGAGTIRRAAAGKLAAAAQAKVAFSYPDFAAPGLDAKVRGGVDAGTGKRTGAQALLDARDATGLKPGRLIAPSYSGAATGSPPNALTTLPTLAALAQRLRAICISDAPNTNDADAIKFAELAGSDRVYVIDPSARVADGTGFATRPMSPFAAGAWAASDAERGWWASPSNYPVQGLSGTARGVDFEMGEPASRANLLNAGNVVTVIRLNGFRLWGNRGAGGDAKWQFVAVRRTADILNESLLEAHLWAVDRCVGREYLEQVAAGVNAFIRDLKARGAVVGGRCWADPDLNTPSSIQGGRVYFDFDFTPCYPAERVTFRSALTGAYLEEIFA